jgi:signal transduction histidine kinase
METDSAQADRELAARRELFAVLAHELRSPIGAILGFEELLSEGILGEVPTGAQDALGRIRSSALQLLSLVAGLNDLAAGSELASQPATEIVSLPPVLERVLQNIASEAAGRGTDIRLAPAAELPGLRTDAERVERALQLALMAAVKSTAEGAIGIEVRPGDHAVEFRISAPGLSAENDEPEHTLHAAVPRLSSAGLRIAMARQTLRPLGGEMFLESSADGSLLRLRLPVVGD